MFEKNPDFITHDLASFGNLNTLLYFKVTNSYFEKIYCDLLRCFKAIDINYSLFDLDVFEMRAIEPALALSHQNSNSILRIIFHNEKESMHLEYFKGHVIVEHLVRPMNIQLMKGAAIIKKYRNAVKKNAILVLGFELSILINDFENSLESNLSDISLHPIIVISVSDNRRILLEEYDAVNSKVNEIKKEIMHGYLKLL
ncbi:MAG: hypothetical protein JNL49_11060 [Bacteroidia bacterium]|nr:hypothetical protein [Bacteroidia bacterium]